MSQFLSIIGWSFLPNIATSWIQTIYYGITIRAGAPRPQPGSPRFNHHRRNIHVLVIALYLAYTIYEADYDLRRQGSFYTDLGVPFSASDRDVKSRFRRLAALHHPDKTGADASDSAAYFIHLKAASDTLQDAARRFAYERFGPETVAWQKCVTVRDYVSRGVFSGILPHYAVAAASIYLLGLLGYMDFGKFYRWLILLSLCVFEIQAVTRPRFPTLLEGLNFLFAATGSSHPPYLPFQLLSLARKLTITIYIALSQIGPLLKMDAAASRRSADDENELLLQGLQRLETITGQFDADSTRLMDMEMAPFKGDAEATANLQGKMREWLIQNTIRADPMVRDALGTSLRKRRVDVPAGAKGNR